MPKLNSGLTHPKRDKALEERDTQDQETNLQASDQTQITPPHSHPRAGEFSVASSLFSLLPHLLFSSISDLFSFVTLKPKPRPNVILTTFIGLWERSEVRNGSSMTRYDEKNIGPCF
nr:hypothetical protein CFP56_64394 [Quercus suber]